MYFAVVFGEVHLVRKYSTLRRTVSVGLPIARAPIKESVIYVQLIAFVIRRSKRLVSIGTVSIGFLHKVIVIAR